jgi:hypothetical protein
MVTGRHATGDRRRTGECPPVRLLLPGGLDRWPRHSLPAAEISARLKERGVLINPVGATWMRLVTHYDVDREGCEMALAALAEVATFSGANAAAH